jgi:hypothetical protein
MLLCCHKNNIWIKGYTVHQLLIRHPLAVIVLAQLFGTSLCYWLQQAWLIAFRPVRCLLWLSGPYYQQLEYCTGGAAGFVKEI